MVGRLFETEGQGQKLGLVTRHSEQLHSDGAGFDNIVDEMAFVTDMEAALACATEVRREAYGGDAGVTSTLLAVAGLAFPELLVEIRCTASLG